MSIYKGENKSTRGMKLPLRILLIAIGMMVLMTLGLFIYAGGLGDVSRDPDDDTMVTLEIPEGSTTGDIGDQLEKEKVVDDANGFKFFTVYKKYDGKYQAGIYALSPSMTNQEIADILISGKTNEAQVTVPEGYTEYEMAAKLGEMGLVNEKEFVELLENKDFSKDYPFLKQAQKGKHRLEGYLFPDTYSIPVTAEGSDIIQDMLDRYSQVFTDELRARAKELGYTENQIITIASIIEKEAAVDEDRAPIASVIYNRLEVDMPLQMDSTIQYILHFDDNRKKDLSIDDTQIESEYNTYTNAGIPPGPICSPGEASIKAALYPADTDYMYFILSPKLDDTMKFSKDYDEFLKDKDDYYEARDKAEGN